MLSSFRVKKTLNKISVPEPSFYMCVNNANSIKLNKARDFVIQRIHNKYVWMCHRKFSYLRNVCTAIYTKCARIFSY